MIEFDKGAHEYRLDGVRIPSVTQIVSAQFPDMYEGIPDETLKKKADYGDRVHAWIEAYCTTGVKKRQSELMKLSTDQVKRIVDDERLRIQRVEQIVHTDHYAGTYDMYGTWRGVPTLIDIKSTATLHTEYLQMQLAMYKYAMDLEVEKCACLWVPKGQLARLVEIEPVSRERVEWMVYRYESEHHSD